MNYFMKLIDEAELTLFFMSGSGIGAVLLCIIAVIFILRINPRRIDLLWWINALRGSIKPTGDDTPSK